MHSKKQIAAAIEAEANAWAIFFGSNDPAGLEARKLVMRANVSVGYLEPLLPYLPTVVKIDKINPERSGDWHDKPLRWSVTGPSSEVQKFSTWKDARKYASIRRQAESQIEAMLRFASFVEV